jgi:septation ring formation regulator EzrA
MEVKAECERKSGQWWVKVPALDDLMISSRRLDLAAEQIKDLVSEKSGIERCDIILKVQTSIPGVMQDLESAQEKMRQSLRLQEEASKEVRDVVARLRGEGLSMRDIGVLLRISPQRVAQLAESV